MNSVVTRKPSSRKSTIIVIIFAVTIVQPYRTVTIDPLVPMLCFEPFRQKLPKRIIIEPENYHANFAYHAASRRFATLH